MTAAHELRPREHYCYRDGCDCIDWRITQAGVKHYGFENPNDALFFMFGLATALRHPEWAKAIVEIEHYRWGVAPSDHTVWDGYDDLVRDVPLLDHEIDILREIGMLGSRLTSLTPSDSNQEVGE